MLALIMLFKQVAVCADDLGIQGFSQQGHACHFFQNDRMVNSFGGILAP